MSELKWIKHTGNSMPVSGDTPVSVIGKDGYKFSEWLARFFDGEGKYMWNNGMIAEYAIVSPSYALGKETAQIGNALSRQEGGSHYKDMAIQPVEYIMANNLGFCEGAIIKYVSRYKAKNGVEDLRKARHFIDMLIEREEKAQANG